jgi:hypothetical protein
MRVEGAGVSTDPPTHVYVKHDGDEKPEEGSKAGQSVRGVKLISHIHHRRLRMTEAIPLLRRKTSRRELGETSPSSRYTRPKM